MRLLEAAEATVVTVATEAKLVVAVRLEASKGVLVGSTSSLIVRCAVCVPILERRLRRLKLSVEVVVQVHLNSIEFWSRDEELRDFPDMYFKSRHNLPI